MQLLAREAVKALPAKTASTTACHSGPSDGPCLTLVRRKSTTWIGLMPSLIEPDDLVCTFYDCDVVVLLRPLGGGHCHIIGTALLFSCVWEVSSESIHAHEGNINNYNSGAEEVAFHVDVKTLKDLAI